MWLTRDLPHWWVVDQQKCLFLVHTNIHLIIEVDHFHKIPVAIREPFRAEFGQKSVFWRSDFQSQIKFKNLYFGGLTFSPKSNLKICILEV